MNLKSESDGSQFDLDAALADYMRRIDRGELLDRDAFIAAHPSLADELRKYFSTASATERLVAGTVDMERDHTDRKHSATVAYTPFDNASPSVKADEKSPRMTLAGERFRILRSHAVGGLGEVSLAHDEQLNRVVALKEIQDRYSTDAAKIARFLLEGEVTGSLEHPGIVPVYAMGQDTEGRPFYAMQFIRGESLREAIRNYHKGNAAADNFNRNSLVFRQLLSRVVDVCNAVAFAHDRGVLHRDIKPENVMLGNFGEALLVDWGMARVIGRPVPESTVERELRPAGPKHFSATREGSALGTPAYMSPEVAAGKLDLLGPPCDIFSLGATLYCLLTNQPPLHANSLTELLSKAERCDFPEAIEVNPRVPKALNGICRRAMALKPADRYTSALELAADIERWLADEAVTAYEEPLPERMFRWLRRHRSWALSGAAAICAVTLVSAIAAVWINGLRRQAEALATREAAARKEAVEKFAQSRRTVDKWLTGFTQAVEYYPGVQDFRDRMLAEAAENYSQFAQQVSDDPDLELERGRTLVRLGDVRHNLLETAAAADAYREAAKVFESLPQRGISPATAQLEAANVLFREGILAAEANKTDDAERSYSKAIEALQGLTASEVDSQRLTLSLVDVHNSYGSLLINRRELDGAERQLKQAIDLQSGLVRAQPTDLKLRGPLADARLRMGQLLIERGNAREAVAQIEQAIQDWDQMVALAPDHPEPFQSRAAARISLAIAWRQLGYYSREGDAYRKAIEDYTALHKSMPDAPLYRENIALTESDLGQLLNEIGRPREAADMLVKTRDQLQALADSLPNLIRCRQELAICLDNLGQSQSELGLWPEALTAHEKAEALLGGLTKEFPDEPLYQESQAIARSHVGQARAAVGESQPGIDSLQAAIAQLEQLHALNKNLVTTTSALAAANSQLGDVYYATGQLEKAREVYAAARRIWDEAIKQSPSAEYLHRAASFLAMCPADAAPDKTFGLEYAERASNAAPDNGQYLGTLAMAEFRTNRPAEANQRLDRASKSDSYDRGRDELIRALCQNELGQAAEAEKTLAQVATWIADNRPGNNPLQRLLAEVKRTIAAKDSAK